MAQTMGLKDYNCTDCVGNVATLEIVGISCSIAFQYFRPEPLWIPLSWNTLFLAINAVMVALLLKERYDAGQLDHDTAALYDQARDVVYGRRKIFGICRATVVLSLLRTVSEAALKKRRVNEPF